jgi:hypothetical protein
MVAATSGVGEPFAPRYGGGGRFGGGGWGGGSANAGGALPGMAPGPGGRGTWFNVGLAIGEWDDVHARRRGEGPQASGLPHTEPGIAMPNRKTLGDWFKVTLPDGRTAYWRQSDVGPGPGNLDHAV